MNHSPRPLRAPAVERLPLRQPAVRQMLWMMVCATLLLLSAPATAQQSRSNYGGWKTTNRADIPVQVGVGPSGVMVNGGVFDDQPIHLGVRIDLEAIVTSDLVREHPKVVPRQYRNQLLAAGEVRVRPLIAALLPTAVYFSPKFRNTGMYGATWSLFPLGQSLRLSSLRVRISGSPIATAFFMHSDTLASPTFFVRPGIDINLDVEIPVARDFGLSFGWSSMLHLPQRIGGPVFEMGSFDEGSIWHIGQLYLQGNFRFPHSIYYR